MERSAGGQAPVPAEISGPISRRGPNSTCGGNNFPNPLVEGVADEEVPGTVGVHVTGNIKRGPRGRAGIPAVAKSSIPGHGLDRSRRRDHFPNAIVAGIRNEEVPGTVDEYSRGDTERGASSRAAIAAEGRGCTPASGNGLNIPVGSQHFPDPVVIGIRYKDVSETVDGQVAGAKECCVGSRTTISRESKVSSPGHGLNHS